jgi:hypothetical protein
MSKQPNFDDMSRQAFNAYQPASEDEVAGYEAESEYRRWCQELDLDPMAPANRETYKEYRDEYDPERFDKDELKRRLGDSDKD